MIIPASHATIVSREVIPASGGQTIRLPRYMRDAQTLWDELTEKEKRTSLSNLHATDESMFTNTARWLPIADHESARHYLHRFTHNHRELATRALQRAEEHLPVIVAHLHRHNLPLELASLPLVESAFEPDAVSSAGAVGLWQLMPTTARRFGLIVSDRLDERFDAHKSTRAAIAYLSELYSLFEDWPLALAAYNSGEGTLKKALDRSGSTTLADLTAYTRSAPSANRVLKEETLNFVPKFTVAVQLMTQSQKLGFTRNNLLEGVQPQEMQLPTPAPRPLLLSGKYRQDEQAALPPPQSARISQF